MSADIIPFRDPSAPMEGAARDAALELCREGCRGIAAHAVSRAFSEVCKLPGCEQLSIDDAIQVFVEAMQRELSRAELSR